MPWPLMSCGIADHRRLGDLRVGDQRAFHLGGAHAVAGDVDHVVDPAGDPVIPVLIAPRAVAGEIQAVEGREIGLHETLVVAVHGAHLAGPGIGDAQIALGRAVQLLPVAVDDQRLHAGQRQRRRAGLQRAWHPAAADQDAAGLGLPPGIDDRAAMLAHDAVVPQPGLGIDRLADRCRACAATLRLVFFTGASPSRISARIAVGAV